MYEPVRLWVANYKLGMQAKAAKVSTDYDEQTKQYPLGNRHQPSMILFPLMLNRHAANSIK